MDESSPLLQFPGMTTGQSSYAHLGDHHTQFCHLVGARPLNLPPGQKHAPDPQSLYARALSHRRHQSRTYLFTATLTNGMLLSQVVLGAALTGLGASDSSRVLITIFGALNTVIAGMIAFLKARGQPVRARMFRDDLDRVVDEIENSAVMWLGISRNVHGYDAIDTDDAVTVRSEVARLTRLYDRAVKTNTMNDPDMYAAGQVGAGHDTGLRGKPAATPAQTAVTPAGVTVPPTAVESDESPATKLADVVAAPDPAPEAAKNVDPAPVSDIITTPAKPDVSQTSPLKPEASNSAPPAATPPLPPNPTEVSAPLDPDESPATAPLPPSRRNTEKEKTKENFEELTNMEEENKKEKSAKPSSGSSVGGDKVDSLDPRADRESGGAQSLQRLLK